MKLENSLNVLRSAYEKRTGKNQSKFRLLVMARCGWSSQTTFYKKLRGKSELTELEDEAIKKLDKQLS